MEDKLIVFKKMQNIKFDLKKKYSLITGAGGLLGYEHAANFYRAFKQQLGMTATEFRNRRVK